ncbi:hypothetical protein C8Q69DRAFT_476732 [Paecilomyces variotii]|uniref:Uncharacterized protein n=1 Tax=Byssochlamys spectabilis TaxID=264951 RepID=A0A443HM66_BYSSP|nr:hypothetical protein C8Q69DRAFT_476732 [Paecilomyces variotii]RWQ92896.1 hypothetical protein C8Q69DRAFT_476732 [Paecilomyces variotii]
MRSAQILIPLVFFFSPFFCLSPTFHFISKMHSLSVQAYLTTVSSKPAMLTTCLAYFIVAPRKALHECLQPSKFKYAGQLSVIVAGYHFPECTLCRSSLRR